MRFFHKHIHGFSLVEVIIVSAILLLVFGGLFSSFKYTLGLIANSKAKMTALALITDRLEYIRSLPYDAVGTIGGLPNRSIPQYRIIEQNGVVLYEQVFVDYFDDPADGETYAFDNNGIINDYKRVKIKYEWNISGSTSTVSISSIVVPRSIETDDGGGTIRVNVFDANVLPLSGIDVRLYNASTTAPVDVIRQTGPTGEVLFTGAPAGPNYEIFVSEPLYSSDQTYQATTSLPYPSTLPVAVLEGDVSTMNFQVDRLSTSTVKLAENQVFAEVTEEFSDLLGLATSTDVESVSDKLRLRLDGGFYVTSGDAWLTPLEPTPLEGWGFVTFTATEPLNTTALISFYTSTSSADLIPDSVLLGNSAGFSPGSIDLRTIPVAAYDTIVPRLQLNTTDTTFSPEVEEILVTYLESEDVVGNQDFTLVSSRSIGTDDMFVPVAKWDFSTSTDVSGVRTFIQFEWGSYALTVPGYSIRSICPTGEFTVSPNVTATTTITLDAVSLNSLRVIVKNSVGSVVPKATVTLRQGMTEYIHTTDWCGQAYIGGLSADTYALEVSGAGYTTATIDPLDISGTVVQGVTLAD